MNRNGRVFQAGTQRRSVAELPGRRRAGPQRQARQAAHALRLGLHAAGQRPSGCRPSRPPRRTWSTGTSGSARRRGGRTTRRTSQGGWRGYYDFDSGAPAARLGRAHRRPLPVGQQGRRHHARRVRAVVEERSRARYANGVKLVLDFLETPFGERPRLGQHLGTCPVRFVGDEGWVEDGRQRRDRSVLAVAEGRAEGPAGVEDRAWTSRRMPATSSTASRSRGADGGQPQGDAALAHRLPRRGARLDARSQAHARPGQGGVRRRRRGQRPASRPSREPWAELGL